MLTIDLITRVHNGGIGAVFIAADVIAHDCDRRCARLIVGICHQAGRSGIDAKGAKEIAGDEFAIARIDWALRYTAVQRPGIVVMADAVVSHAFSHGFYPQHIDRLGRLLDEVPWWAEHVLRLLRRRDQGGQDAQRNGEHDEIAAIAPHRTKRSVTPGVLIYHII